MSIDNHNVQDVIGFIINAQCRMPLAVERYNREFGASITTEEMFSIILSDPTNLFGQLKINLVMKLFDNMMKTQIALEASLESLKPGELSRLYVGQMTAFGTLTNKPIEDTNDVPTDFIAAKRNLLDRVQGYARRKENLANGIVEEEADSG